MKNKARVHRLPTDIKAKDWRNQVVTLKDGTGLSVNNTQNHQDKVDLLTLLDAKCIPQHLYITTDEEIKEGDWCYYQGMGIGKYEKGEAGNIRKIIATTDTKLFRDGDAGIIDHVFKEGMFNIPQSFIEEYCKAGGIDEVLVEYEYSHSTSIKLSMDEERDVRHYKPKLDSNNCIIIHPVEEKMIPLSIVSQKIHEAIKFARLPMNMLNEEQIDKWIEENL